MSKKNVLNEVRRFMKLANLDANLSSNFVGKLEEMETAYVRDDETMQEEEAEEMEAELEMPEEEAEGEEEAGEEEEELEL